MNTKRVADLMGVSHNTVRRWCERYAEFLVPGATPGKGRERKLNETNQRILLYIASLRQNGELPHDVAARLRRMKQDGWQDLPELPDELRDPEGILVTPQDLVRLQERANVAALQTELTAVRRELVRVEEEKQAIELRLSTDLDRTRAEKEQTEQRLTDAVAERSSLQVKLHEAEVLLAQLRGQVDTLEARLNSYTSLIGTRPLNLLLILGLVAVLTAILILAAFVISAQF